MNGGEQIARVLRHQGVRFLFTLCGGHISPILVEAKKHGIRVIDVRQEPTAVFAADAVSRLTGIPGVAAVTAGPGVTNAVTAVKNAQMAQSPLVLIGGAPATALKGRGALQDIDQIGLFKTLTKWSAAIRRDCDIAPVLEEAFDAAVSGVPGPVFVECPVDLLYDPALVREWYAKEIGKPRNLRDRAIQWYLRRHVDKMFACSPKSLELAAKESIVPFALDTDAVAAAASRIRAAKKPVMIIGSQALLRVDRVGELARKLADFNMPVYLAGMARGLLGADHPMQFKHGRSKALKEADLVLIAGMPCDFRLGYGKSIGKKAFYIAVNRSASDLKKNRKPNLAVAADPGTFLLALTAQVRLEQHRLSEWLDRLRAGEQQGEEKITAFAAADTQYANPLSLCRSIDAALDDDSVLVGDGGDFVATASYILRPRSPLSWLDPGVYGTLGVGAGFALGAKLVRPEADVWLLYGDGASGYGLIEQDTFVRHNTPVITVIGNDAGWTQIARDQSVILGDDVGSVLRYNRYHEIAEALDAKGYLIDGENGVDDILRRAIQDSREGRPVLINALIGKTDYRKGSISM
ncbi:MAG: thiamine pyrophosphate-binding protein [Desulfobacteraceae bacterium]|jgi:acetolactate synthase-1/2/3 large subunit|nr:MAG: thiamine pyrophosphate-binding protein [Desulfobacteraceae bacterium]